MATTATETDAAKAAEKAAKEAERKAKAEAKEAERAEKAKQREAEKERKAKEVAEAKAKRVAEQVQKILAEIPKTWKSRPERGTGPDGSVTVGEAREALKAFKAEERANRPKKAPLTLSQRRAILNLAEAGKAGIVPKTGFNALPLDYLVGVGLAETFKTKATVQEKTTVEKEVEIPEAERKEGGPTTKTVKEKVTNDVEKDATGYRLTATGQERVGEINPKWKTWKPDRESVAS